MNKEPRMRCHFRGPEVGPVKCNCSGTVKASVCHNSEHVPSGYCTNTMPSNAIDGPIKMKDGTETIDRYMAFSFKQMHIDRGQVPWDTWILCCDECPFHKSPPPQVLELYLQRQSVNTLIARYENAVTMDEREKVSQDLNGKRNENPVDA
jgi:hypothetical protein